MKAWLSLTLFSLVACCFIEARADTIVINATYTGWYRNDGTNNADGSGGSITGPSLYNYVVGQTVPETVRNYFVFNLSGVTGLETLTSSQLRIFSPTSSLPSFGSGYGSTDPREIYAVYDVSTDPNTLGTARGVSIFNDLGTGILFGTVIVTLQSSNGLVVTTDLNAAAIAELQQNSGLFAFGGTLTTLDPTRTTPEFIFGGTGIGQPRDSVRLVLSGSRVEVVPEPATILVFVTALAGVAAVCRRRYVR
jgi:hypothetical protein